MTVGIATGEGLSAIGLLCIAASIGTWFPFLTCSSHITSSGGLIGLLCKPMQKMATPQLSPDQVAWLSGAVAQ
jgi:hypothetical protein